MRLEPGKDYVVRLGDDIRVLTLDVNPHWQVQMPFLLHQGEDLYYCDEEGTVDPARREEWRVLGVHHKGVVMVGERIGFYCDGLYAYGVVRAVQDGYGYAVEVDQDKAEGFRGLHDCFGMVSGGRGWWVGGEVFDWSPAPPPVTEPETMPEAPDMHGFKVGDVVVVDTGRFKYTATVLGAHPELPECLAVRPHSKPDGLIVHKCAGLAPDCDGRWEKPKDLTLFSEDSAEPVHSLNSEERAQIWAAFTHSNRSIEECIAAWSTLINKS